MMFRRVPKIEITTPCHESWGGMAGHHHTRFCNSCQKYVHDFASMTRKEALRVIDESEGELCGRITRNAAGEIQFRKEPDSGLFQNLVRISALGASAFGSEARAQSCKVEVRATNPSEGVIPDAAVAVFDSDNRGLMASGQTGEDGTFNTQLPTGTYQFTVARSGMEPSMQSNIEVNCGTQAKDFALEARLKPRTSTDIEATVEASELVVTGSFAVAVPRSPLRRAAFAIRRTIRRALNRN